MLGQELQQLELLEGQLEDPAAYACGVRGLVDADVAGADLVGYVVAGPAGSGQAPGRDAQPGLELGRACGVEQDLVHAPVGADGNHAALGHDEEDGHVDAGRTHQTAQAADLRQLAAPVDEDRVALRGIEQRGRLGRGHAYLVHEQAEGGQHLG